MNEAFAALPLFLIEDQVGRQAASLLEIKARGSFWSVVSTLNWSIENLIREMPVPVTARSLFKLASKEFSQLPDGIVVSNLGSSPMALSTADQIFEISYLRGFEKERRVDLKWSLKGEEPAWFSGSSITERLERLNYRLSFTIQSYFRDRSSGPGRMRYFEDAFIPRREVVFEDLDGFGAVEVFGRIYFRPGLPVLEQVIPLTKSTRSEELARGFIYLETLKSLTSSRRYSDQLDLDRHFRQLAARGLHEHVPDWKEFSEAAIASKLRSFDPFAWSRRSFEEFD